MDDNKERVAAQRRANINIRRYAVKQLCISDLSLTSDIRGLVNIHEGKNTTPEAKAMRM